MAALSSVLAQIRANESSNNYNLTPQQNYAYPASHASGAYQFQPGTWQQYTQQSGIGTQYAEAYQAPPNVQDAVASYAVLNGPGVNSKALWGASAPPGGYQSVTNVDVTPQSLASSTSGGGMAQGPNVAEGAGTPAAGGTGYYVGHDASGSPVATTDPSTDPGITDWQFVPTGQTGGQSTGGQGGGGAGGGSEATQAAIPGMILEEPATVGLSTGLAGATDSWIKGAENAVGTAFKNAWAATLGAVTNLALRFFLILAGLVVIAIALWKLVNPGLDAKDLAALMTKVPA
jgi:hypothetical protein